MANATVKATKVQKFNEIAKVLVENGFATISVNGEEVDVKAFCEHEVELIQKKASSKKSVDNSANAELIAKVLGENPDGLAPAEIAKVTGLNTTQKVSAVVKNMDNVQVVKNGKKVIYKLA